MVKSTISSILFPNICLQCGEGFEDGLSNILCRSCFTAVSTFEDPVCDHCGISLPMRAFEDAIWLRCRDCGAENYYLDRVRAVGPYEGALRIAHHGFKFEGMEGLHQDLAGKMSEAAIPAFWDGVEALVPVPLSAERERERGYNPAGLLAQQMCQSLQIPLGALLCKIKSTKPQMSLTREERLKNPKGAYQLNGQEPVPPKVVLVDDVFTTGATLEECAKVLKKAGATWVGAIVFGRTPRH
jgi:competence protein ComFC